MGRSGDGLSRWGLVLLVHCKILSNIAQHVPCLRLENARLYFYKLNECMGTLALMLHVESEGTSNTLYRIKMDLAAQISNSMLKLRYLQFCLVGHTLLTQR